MQIVAKTPAMSATPPTTPPTMAPTGTDFNDDDDDGKDNEDDDDDDDDDAALGGGRPVTAAVALVAPLRVATSTTTAVVGLVVGRSVSGLCAPNVHCSSIQRRVGDARHAKPLTPATGSV